MGLHILFAEGASRIGLEDGPAEAPQSPTLSDLLASLRTAQAALRATPISDLIGLCDAAANAWTKPSHPMAAVIRRFGLGFLPFWMRRSNLETLCRRSLRGQPAALDGFVPLLEGDNLLCRAQPRGIAVHWVAGNVPVLGWLSLLQSFLCKNANVLKAPRHFAGLIPHLLESLRDISYTTPQGHTVAGSLLADTTAVVYADRDDLASAEALSMAADVRVAWGGREAIEAITSLPRRFDTEDVVFGPKLSFAVVGRERLTPASAHTTALAVAADAMAFEQQGCNCPHTVFVERGGELSPAEFAKVLAEALGGLAERSPLADVQPAQAMQVLTVRTEYAMRGNAYHGEGMGWTVLFAEEDRGTATPCYLRTLFVRPVDDVFDVAEHCSRHTQTAGMAVDDRRRALAEALTARGVDRCPLAGSMRLYDAPWDGLFAMERLARWVSVSP